MDAVEAVVSPAATYYIERVKRKQATGVYPLEPVACFCGYEGGQTVTETDRYGFVHHVVVCPRCGILRATPRMTADAYRQFYEHEYRQIYDDMDEGQDDVNFENSVERGGWLKDFLEPYECVPKTVFELGCNAGGWLKPFMDAGATCCGVDYGPARIAYGQARGLPIQQGGLEQLEQRGEKADLIITSHVIEHFLDLPDTLARLRALLTDNGLLFVRAPSLFTWRYDVLFQNAHTYQFTSGTLAYVMECCGFEEVYLNERIDSLWRRSDEYRSKTTIDREELYRILKFVSGDKQLLPVIKTINKFPLVQRRANLKQALATDYPDIRDLRLARVLHDRPSLIIGGGPSVDLQVEQIERLQQAGAAIVTIERMLPWCLQHGLTPEYVVTMDASDDVTEAFTTLPSVSTYLVATQCQPAVLAALKGHSIYLFNTPQKGIAMADLWDDANREYVTQVNAGGSVTLCAMSLAMTLGSRVLHIFGFDCHITNGGYATGIAGVGEQLHAYEIRVEGTDRLFRVTSPYVSFAQQFFRLIEMARHEGQVRTVQVYGDSLVNVLHRPDGPLRTVLTETPHA